MLDVNAGVLEQACSYLGLESEDVLVLQAAGLVVLAGHAYEQASLDLSLKLLAIGKVRSWGVDTLAWYADLILATQVGHSILLPLSNAGSAGHPISWLGTSYVQMVLEDMENDELESEEGPFIALLRSLASTDLESYLRASAAAPIIEYLESRSIAVWGQSRLVARDSAPILLSLVLVFTSVVHPLSMELSELIKRLEPHFVTRSIPSDERAKIEQEGLIAVDQLYVLKAAEIHSSPVEWDIRVGVISTQKKTISLQMKTAPDSTEAMIDNIIDLIRPFVGQYGARIVHLLYEIANDPPNYRSPLIDVETNDLLDRLGLKRKKPGFHHSSNRKRLRDALNVAHSLEIVGKVTVREAGQAVTTKAFFRTLISIISADFDPEEIENIPDTELRLKGLPRKMRLRLNFYDGVRAPDGGLGSEYVLLPRLDKPNDLGHANHTATHEMIKTFLFFTYRQTHNLTLFVVRSAILEQAGIRNKNDGQATVTLGKALDRLMNENVIERYNKPLPTRPSDTFTITLRASAVAGS